MKDISRIRFCPACAKAGRPRTSNVYAVIGGTSGELQVKRARRYEGVTAGYTPHFITWIKQIGDKVVYEASCGIINCGVTLNETEEGYEVISKERYRHVIDYNDWRALKDLWTGSGYEI